MGDMLKSHDIRIHVRFMPHMQYVTMIISVPDMLDDEEYIDEFLEEVVGDDKFYDLEWDYEVGVFYNTNFVK